MVVIFDMKNNQDKIQQTTICIRKSKAGIVVFWQSKKCRVSMISKLAWSYEKNIQI